YEGVGVPHFIVIPRHHFHQISVNDSRKLKVNDRGVPIALYIRRYERLVGYREDALPSLFLGRVSEDLIDLFDGSFPFCKKRHVDDRSDDDRNTDRYAIKFARELRESLGHRYSRARRRRHDVLRRCPTLAKIFLGRTVDNGLARRIRMNRI